MSRHHETPVEKVIELEEAVVKRLTRGRRSALEKHPFLFVLLTTAGTILTFSGFQKLIERLDWLVGNPPLMVALGLGILFLTGALYKKLG